jgi:hypothetical protein
MKTMTAAEQNARTARQKLVKLLEDRRAEVSRAQAQHAQAYQRYQRDTRAEALQTWREHSQWLATLSARLYSLAYEARRGHDVSAEARALLKEPLRPVLDRMANVR